MGCVVGRSDHSQERLKSWWSVNPSRLPQSWKQSLWCIHLLILQLPEMWPTSPLGLQSTGDRGATWMCGYEQAAENSGFSSRHSWGGVHSHCLIHSVSHMPEGHAGEWQKYGYPWLSPSCFQLGQRQWTKGYEDQQVEALLGYTEWGEAWACGAVDTAN